MKCIMNNSLVSFTQNQANLTYSFQRALISLTFKNTSGTCYGKAGVLLRLTMIDSMYSTNARFNYFALDEMADEIISLGPTEMDACLFFDEVVQLKCKKKATSFFNKQYGISKNVSKGSVNLSLMTKYSYYALLQFPQKFPLGFPIYDNLVKSTCRALIKSTNASAFINNCCKFNSSNAFKGQKKPDINEFIEALEDFRNALFGNKQLVANQYQQFDILDAYLWKMGKFSNGNLSLILNEKDYKRFIQNINLCGKNLKSSVFNNNVANELKINHNPFAGIASQAYLDNLLNHWKKYII